jgi:hypothetical protein
MSHPRDYSFFAEVTRFYHLKQEAPTPDDNLTPRERRLFDLGPAKSHVHRLHIGNIAAVAVESFM